MGSRITKVEYFLPQRVVTNEDLANQSGRWSAAKIEKKVGIRERHIVEEDETALDLAYEVSVKVLKGYDKNKIDIIILCTQSPDYYLPASACILQDKLGLGTHVGAFDYSLGCSGYIYGLAIGKSFINSGLAGSVLLITSETLTKHIHERDFSNRTIFGDGAAATIIEKNEEEFIFDFVLGTDGKGWDTMIIPSGGMRNRYNPNEAAVEDETGNLRTSNNLSMNGPEVFNFTIDAVPRVVRETLEKNRVQMDEIDYFIFHQANKYMIDYLRKKIKIPENKFFSNMLYTGNTVSATIPIALKETLDDGTLKKGDNVLLCAFGVGYSWGATIIKI